MDVLAEVNLHWQRSLHLAGLAWSDSYDAYMHISPAELVN